VRTYERASAPGGIFNYLVDQYDVSTEVYYTVQPSVFLSQSISVTTNQTYTPAVFTFTLLTDNPIPINGKLRVVVPSDISVVSTVGCAANGNISTSLSCTISGQNITIVNGWPTTGISRLTLIAFNVTGLRTPISTKTSESF
jgi:hypothetical protein